MQITCYTIGEQLNPYPDLLVQTVVSKRGVNQCSVGPLENPTLRLDLSQCYWKILGISRAKVFYTAAHC